jgi:hypothetical protein
MRLRLFSKIIIQKIFCKLAHFSLKFSLCFFRQWKTLLATNHSILDLTSSSLGANEDIALVKASVLSAALSRLHSFTLSMVAGGGAACELSNCSATGSAREISLGGFLSNAQNENRSILCTFSLSSERSLPI